MSVHEFSVTTIDGEQHNLADEAGSVLLIVNVASACGLTPQYEGLQALQQQYQDQGFKVLGFPCNQFAGQEPGSHEEIKNFCSTKFAVTFPLFAKVDVNGEDAIPLFNYLRAEQPGNGDSDAIEWNFAKFLVDQNGSVVKRYSPKAEPAELAADIAQLLK